MVTKRKKVSLKKQNQEIHLPGKLVSRETLADLRQRIKGKNIEPTPPEPKWTKLCASLQKQHELTEEQAEELTSALERLWLLPFHRYEACYPLVLFFFTQLGAVETRFAEDDDKVGLALTKAFRVLVELMLQGCSLFPAEPQYIGRVLMDAIITPTPKTLRNLLPMARLLADASSSGQCGSNHYLAQNPNEIAIYEHLLRRGRFEDVIKKSSHKFDDYSQEVTNNPSFWKEWNELKAGYKKHDFWDEYGIVRRSMLLEGNWRHGIPLPDFTTAKDSFQIAFDVFCWKWFLYGMRRARPRDIALVQKVVYTFGPYGTTIFIPGYWSFDAARDFDWSKINRLHRARGVQRQGEKLSENRKGKAEQVKRLKAAKIQAKKMGLSGTKQMDFLKDSAGLSQRTDDAQVRRLLREQ
jgi:hypothetical protein